MSYETTIDEPVKVWALFDHEIFPIAMSWQRKLVKFEKLILKTKKRIGQVKILTLVCASDTANYELEYNSESQIWKVLKVMPKDGEW